MSLRSADPAEANWAGGEVTRFSLRIEVSAGSNQARKRWIENPGVSGRCIKTALTLVL